MSMFIQVTTVAPLLTLARVHGANLPVPSRHSPAGAVALAVRVIRSRLDSATTSDAAMRRTLDVMVASEDVDAALAAVDDAPEPVVGALRALCERWANAQQAAAQGALEKEAMLATLGEAKDRHAALAAAFETSVQRADALEVRAAIVTSLCYVC